MPRKLLSAPFLCLTLCLSFPALAQSIFSWKDANGTVHYSDTPPPDGTVRTFKRTQLTPETPAVKDSKAAPAAPGVIDQELAMRKRSAEAAEAEDKSRKERARNEERLRLCTSAKAQLAGLEGGQRMVRMNAAGEREFLDDEQRAAEIERTRAVADSACN